MELGPNDEAEVGAPSEVCRFLVAGGRPVACWFFFDLKRNAIVRVES